MCIFMYSLSKKSACCLSHNESTQMNALSFTTSLFCLYYGRCFALVAIASCYPLTKHTIICFEYCAGVNKESESLIESVDNKMDEIINLLEKRRLKLRENVNTWKTQKLSEIDKNEEVTDKYLDNLLEVSYFSLSLKFSLKYTAHR